jgi:hypothetical protein
VSTTVGRIALAQPVKLVVGMLSADPSLLAQAAERLTALFEQPDYLSPILPFAFTDYYLGEMGPGLLRQFIAFARLIAPEELPPAKLRTNAEEAELAQAGHRRVNLDPGYLSAGKLVLATTKDQQHRLYLGQGIFGEVTLRYRQGAWRPWDWTYPDYRSPEYGRIFAAIRALYLDQLRGP